nr:MULTISPECIES: Rv3654c family TadE-like protein [unclassified Tessaracoccus]
MGRLRTGDRAVSRHTERGSAGVLLTMGMSLALLASFTVAGVLIAWFSAARHAEQAAELAALAAVSASVQGADPCSAAGEAAVRNGVSVAECAVRGGGRHVVVEIAVRAPLEPALPGAPRTFLRSATAGT